jgi:hypothetical protein
MFMMEKPPVQAKLAHGVMVQWYRLLFDPRPLASLSPTLSRRERELRPPLSEGGELRPPLPQGAGVNGTLVNG